MVVGIPGAVPPAIEFVPFGDEIGRGLTFDTPWLALRAGLWRGWRTFDRDRKQLVAVENK